jgi:anti-sigma B factor antagonist
MDVCLNVTDENELVICARGEADLANAGELLPRLVVLVGAATGQVALDLEQVTFMDYCGLRTLGAIERHVRSAGGSVRVAALSPQVARVLELASRFGALPWIPVAPARPGSRHGGVLSGPAAVDVTTAHAQRALVPTEATLQRQDAPNPHQGGRELAREPNGAPSCVS